MDKLIALWENHGTKILGAANAVLGFFGAVIAALVAVPDLLEPQVMKYALALMGVIGVMTAKRGFTNSAQGN